jgi:hypothetical protein
LVLLRSESALIGIWVLVESGLLLRDELGLGISISSDTRGRLGRVGRGHGSTTLCGCEILVLPAAEEEPDKSTD